MLGNRGGKFHRGNKTLGKRRWATQHWICCELHYKGMHHEPMGQGYTSLFFLDEVTALAAGHRPCFFCRRKEAKAFLGDEKVGVFDRRVHGERSATPSRVAWGSAPEGGRGSVRALSVTPREELVDTPPPPFGVLPQASPGGVMIEVDGAFFAKRGSHLLRWSFSGYTHAQKIMPDMQAKILTPSSILAILDAGYKPRWHPSALQWDNT